jgi:tRNA pseudouridine55 synthase
VVARLRRALNTKHAGHTGTLDPMATGVLPVLVGRATRLARFLNADRKTYAARVRLGFTTDTDDADGQPTSALRTVPPLSAAAIEDVLAPFRGTSTQRPPAYSAKKIGGRRSYALARRGVDVPLEPVVVTLEELVLVDAGDDWLDLRITSSAGFYVRSLARDIGERIGCGAHLAALRRTQVGRFTLPSAVPLESVEEDPGVAARCGIPLADVLSHLPALRLAAAAVKRAVHGNEVSAGELTVRDSHEAGRGVEPFVRLLDDHGDLVAIAEPAARPGLLHPLVVVR